jgi:hypothetical protein
MKRPEIIEAVKVRTKRPDLEDEIWLAIQQATLFVHNKDFYKRDFIELPLVYNPPVFRGQIIFDAALPNFRKVGYIRKYDPIGEMVGSFLKEVEPDKQFDYYEKKKTDIFYVAGKVINWTASCEEKAHLVGYWRYPDVSRERYDSWIADAYPFVIIERSCAKVFDTIGQQEASNSCMRAALEAGSLVDINEIVSQGR